MNEEKKKDLQFVLSAGKKVIAKLKNYSSASNITPYDGNDAFYSDYNKDSANDAKSDKSANKENDNIDLTQDSTTKEQEVISSKDNEMLDKTHLNYQKKNNKFDGIKENLNYTEFFNEFSKKAEALFQNSSLKKEDLEAELDQITVEIIDKMNVATGKADEICNNVASLVDQSKSNYSSIISSVEEISKTTSSTSEIIDRIEQSLNEAKAEINETRESTLGVNKLIDSVFELKSANLTAKTALDELQKIQKRNYILSLIGISVIGVASVATLIISILATFIL